MNRKNERYDDERDHRQQKIHRIGQHDRSRQHDARKVDLVDERGRGDYAGRRAGEAARMQISGQDTDQDENGKFRDALVAQEDSEDEGEDHHHQDGVEEAPEETENRVAIAQLQVTNDEIA